MDTSPAIRKDSGDPENAGTNDNNNSTVLARRSGPVGEEKLRYPCSPGQWRFWLLHQLNPHHPSLNIAARWRLEGAVSNPELEKAFGLIMERHQPLRTYFADADGEVNQFVAPHVPFHIPVVDLTELPESEAAIEMERAARQEACAPFDVSLPPLMRVTHIRLREDVSVLLVTLHHLVSDARSVAILAHELSEICAALRTRRQPVLPDLQTAFGDFAASQAERLAGPMPAVDAEFWEHALHGIQYFEMHVDRARPAMLTANGSVRAVGLNGELTGGLSQLGLRAGGTLQTAVLAGILILLHRYTGEVDIAVGTEVIGREGVGLDNLVGPFSNMLVMRGELSGDPGMLTLLAGVRKQVCELEKHRHVTPQNLIEIAKTSPDLSRNPLFSIGVMSPRSSMRNRNPDAFSLTELPTYSGGGADMTFGMVEGADGWSLCCEYNADLFEERTVIGLLKHFDILMHAAVADPARKISSLTLLGDTERRELVVENNRTRALYPDRQTLPRLFEAQVARTPGAVAVTGGERSMSYRALDIASNRLARELRARGVEPGSRVAVALERSPELIVALLAILKSGSAYIPLDPEYPPVRLQYVLSNARPAALITQSSFGGRLQGVATTILVDGQSELIASRSAEGLAPSASPADPAYIIYTSGSTGKPKGVAIPHRALVNLLCAMRRQPGLTSADTVLAVTTIAFDIAVLECFLPLVVGARLVMATNREMADGGALLGLLRRHAATFMQATPVTWQLLLEAGWRGEPSLRMLCGGEAMPRKLADRLLQCGGELWNMYGPTETTVWSSALRVEAGDGPVPIGPPIANTQFYILDGHQQLVPRGVPGELYIGGDGVAIGYFDLPDLTQARFGRDMFSEHPDARLYRTGDIVCMKQGGKMEYLGRTDHQIKLRGFRIELGEIEAVLRTHADIKEAVAVLGKDSAGEGAIWAYAVPQRLDANASSALIDALRSILLQSLPGYMCPSSIVVLDSLPRTANGKIDRNSLPAPAKVQSREEVQPLNEIERRLARIWKSVLGVEVIGKTASFFDSGGHSLLAARLLARIEAEFGQRLSLLTLFEAPSIGAQATLLMRTGQREYDFRRVVRLQPNGSRAPLIAIHNTGVYFYSLSRRLGPDQPLTALQLFDPSIARQTLPGTLEEVAAEYVQLVRQCQGAGPYKLIGWCVGGVLAFEVARQLSEAGREVSLLAMIDAWAPGHSRRLSRPRAILADFSYRWKLIGADWGRVMSHEQGLATFLAQRTLVKRLRHWVGRSREDSQVRVSFEQRGQSAENYDQWLLGYLDDLANSYEPGLYSGKISLLCSSREPKGMFLDPRMGWSPFASGGVDVAVIAGDHFTVFNGQGLEEMAAHISAMPDASDNRETRHRATA